MIEFTLVLLLGVCVGMAVVRWLWYLGERMGDEQHLYRDS